MLSVPAMLVTVLRPSVTETPPAAWTVTVRSETTPDRSSVSPPAPRSTVTAESAPSSVSSPAPPMTFSMSEMPAVLVAVPAARSIVTPLVVAA